MKTRFVIFFLLILLNLSFLLYGGSLYLGSRATTVVHITEEGFVPSYVQIPAGSKVTWVNKDANPHWPASDFHPTHGQYPSEEKGCLGSTLDACHPLEGGEAYSFVFTQKGAWGMHDHLYLGTTMMVEVVDNVLFSKISAAARWFLRSSKASAPSPEKFLLLEYQEQLEIIKKLSRENAQEAWQYLKSAYITDDGQVLATDTEWLDHPHIFAHIVSNEAYKQYGVAAFSVCSPIQVFNSGCAHGIAEQMLIEVGVEKAKDECFNAPMYRVGCFHGLGHALAVLENYDISRAFEGCGTSAEATACYDGVLMEYVWSGPKPNISQSDPMRFCMRFEHGDARYLCGTYLPLLFMKVFDWDFEQAAVECLRAQDTTIRAGCKKNFGVLAVHIAKGNLQKILQSCSSAETKDYEYLCFASAANEVLHSRFYDWENTALALCNHLPSDMRTRLSWCH